jgi:uncharacterized protein YoxC
MPDLTATNTWLGILAVVSVVEFLVVAAIGVMGFKLYKKTQALIERTEATYIAPLSAKVNMVADEAREVVRKVQHVEERVSGMVDNVQNVAGRVGTVAEHAWPVLGTWRAVSAAVSSLKGERRLSRSRRIA